MKRKFSSTIPFTFRDRRAFLLLWHAKLLTTAALARRVFPTASVQTAYHRLRTLERRGFITQRPDRRGKNWYWTLTQSGYRNIRVGFPQLYDKGFETEFVDHDAAVSAIHLGLAFAPCTESMTYVTEQWLRRVHRDYWFEPLPERLGHRPDGYWLRDENGTPHLIALELERQPKPNSVYESRFFNYQWKRDVTRVLWVASDAKLLRSIARTLFKLEAEHETKHSLFLWSDFVEHGFQMPARRGIDTGKTLAEIVSLNVSRRPQEPVHRYFLDGSRTGVKSMPYRLAAAAAGVDCIAAPIADHDLLRTGPCRRAAAPLLSPQSDRSLKTETQPAGETPHGGDPWQS